MIRDEFLRHGLFVARCVAAAVMSYLAAGWVGLGYPVWASMSGLIVSQEKLNDTSKATLWRFISTLAGVLAAVLIGGFLEYLGFSIAVQLGASVAGCAILVRIWPGLRVAMWTASIVLLTRIGQESVLQTGILRGEEVVVGAIVGLGCHFLAERLFNALTSNRHNTALRNGPQALGAQGAHEDSE